EPVGPGPEHLPEVVVAVDADELADAAELRQVAQPLAYVLAAAENRLERLVRRRQGGEHVLDLVVDRRRQQAERLRARLLRDEGRIVPLRAEQAVQRARHLAEPPQPGEQGGGIARQLLEYQLPAVDRAGDERLEDAERRLQGPADVGVPAGERRDVRELALGEEAQQLELRVQSGLEPAEHLEDELVVED